MGLVVPEVDPPPSYSLSDFSPDLHWSQGWPKIREKTRNSADPRTISLPVLLFHGMRVFIVYVRGAGKMRGLVTFVFLGRGCIYLTFFYCAMSGPPKKNPAETWSPPPAINNEQSLISWEPFLCTIVSEYFLPNGLCHGKRSLLVWQQLRTLGTFLRSTAQIWMNISKPPPNHFRPFKINCLFCISARAAFAVIRTETQAVNSTHCPENRTFFGLKIRQLEAE